MTSPKGAGRGCCFLTGFPSSLGRTEVPGRRAWLLFAFAVLFGLFLEFSETLGNGDINTGLLEMVFLIFL